MRNKECGLADLNKLTPEQRHVISLLKVANDEVARIKADMPPHEFIDRYHRNLMVDRFKLGRA
jgi:hypothetical protein